MMQTNKKSRKTCLFLLVLYYWEETNKSPNLEPYVVLVSYTLWCSSYYISEAVLLSLEDFPFVLCFVGGVKQYLGEKFGWKVTATHLLYYTQLYTSYTSYTQPYRYTIKIYSCSLPEASTLVCWQHTQPNHYIREPGPSHLYTEYLPSQGDNHLNTTYGLFACCEIMRRSVSSQYMV